MIDVLLSIIFLILELEDNFIGIIGAMVTWKGG